MKTNIPERNIEFVSGDEGCEIDYAYVEWERVGEGVRVSRVVIDVTFYEHIKTIIDTGYPRLTPNEDIFDEETDTIDTDSGKWKIEVNDCDLEQDKPVNIDGVYIDRDNNILTVNFYT